ncbi:MAG TPA: DUF4430 domain-containing protein [Solirubrobacteraceae bacterium]|nr:DUF4430 domain-containing protein [Solirubrobacteraceae bacterium]
MLGGCGLGPGETPESPVSLTVTRDFGARTMLHEEDAEVAGADTIMRVTQRNAKVTTRFGGDFVHAIAGISGGRAAGQPVDWFIYLNGILTDKGAGGLRVSGGDRIWWDHHEWGLTPDVPAVVGSFPEPFLRGRGGNGPVNVRCALPRAPACAAVARALDQHGVAIRRSGLRRSEQDGSPRILVGAWKALRDGSPEARSIDQGPKSSGVFARFGDEGARLDILDGRGAVAQRLSGEAGLVAATRRPGGPPVWFVTGTDEPGVRGASRMFDERTLRNRFAVATSADSPLSVPLPGAQEG